MAASDNVTSSLVAWHKNMSSEISENLSKSLAVTTAQTNDVICVVVTRSDVTADVIGEASE